MVPFTIDDLIQVLSQAKSLETYDRERQTWTEKDLLSLRSSEAEITRETLYQMALDDGISAQYVDKALALYYPTREQMIEDLQKRTAVFSIIALSRDYENKLLQSLQTYYPSEQFFSSNKKDWLRDWLDDGHSARQLLLGTLCKTKGWFDREKIKKNDWAKIRIISPSILIDVYNPFFLRACNETLQELNELYKKQIHGINTARHYSL